MIVHDVKVTFNMYKVLNLLKDYEDLFIITVVESKLMEQGPYVNFSDLEKRAELQGLVL